MSESENVEVCPTCQRPKNFASDLTKMLKEQGFFDYISENLAKNMNVKTEIPSDAITSAVEKAVKEIKISPPPIKIVHHSLNDLLSCPNCKPALDEYVSKIVRETKPTAEPAKEVKSSLFSASW